MITDPIAIKFSNEIIRPLSENTRALNALIDNATTQWFGGTNNLFPNDPSEMLDDGREAEGVSRLSGADINSVMSVLQAMRQASNDEIISKPCVRSLSVA